MVNSIVDKDIKRELQTPRTEVVSYEVTDNLCSSKSDACLIVIWYSGTIRYLVMSFL